MFRFFAIAFTLFIANFVSAQDVSSVVFEDQEIMLGGSRVRCELYYVLIGDDASFEQGDLVQVISYQTSPDQFSLSKGRFQISDDELSIFWDAAGGQRFGATEKGTLTPRGSGEQRYTYKITEHDDSSQVNETANIRITPYSQLPVWVKNAISSAVEAKMTLEDRVLLHRLRAEQMKATQSIIDGYLDAIN